MAATGYSFGGAAASNIVPTPTPPGKTTIPGYSTSKKAGQVPIYNAQGLVAGYQSIAGNTPGTDPATDATAGTVAGYQAAGSAGGADDAIASDRLCSNTARSMVRNPRTLLRICTLA